MYIMDAQLQLKQSLFIILLAVCIKEAANAQETYACNRTHPCPDDGGCQCPPNYTMIRCARGFGEAHCHIF